ncbi:Ferredoxin subunit of nitrite reductase and ring-hydroxylating dioxygenase [Caballeronia sordidicola]|uniref:Ferredoxin subunit of nitrite reductase and ring-hydroxylating dioxygenase n=1 Tax=Caballeronia sordidicola TaxID=196367 RepID=A0A2C9XV87_CABSO|nr:Ferredoxin subunit of nitrite reductase and ring-hydroxylating dioxygenase [Caballeronia sordidicola]
MVRTAHVAGPVHQQPRQRPSRSVADAVHRRLSLRDHTEGKRRHGSPNWHHLLQQPEDAARPRGVAAQCQYLRGTQLPAHDFRALRDGGEGRRDRDGKQLRRDPDALEW